MAAVIIPEITLIRSRCGQCEHELRLLGESKIDPLPMVHGAFPLEEAPADFGLAAERGTVTILYCRRHRQGDNEGVSGVRPA